MAMSTTATNARMATEPHAAPARDKAAFIGAQRHSRRVRVIKIALPVVATLLAVGFAGYSYMLSPKAVGVSVDGAAIRDGKLVMANPKLNGFTNENLPYSMSAARAIQDLSNSGLIELEKIDARLPVDASNWATIAADGGVYNENENTLDITTPVTFRTTDGLTAKLSSASIDLGASELRTDDPVDIVQGGSRITAQSLKVLESGKVFVFEKRVRLTIDPDETKTADADGKKKAGN